MFLSKKWITCKWMVDVESFSSTWTMIDFILCDVVEYTEYEANDATGMYFICAA